MNALLVLAFLAVPYLLICVEGKSPPSSPPEASSSVLRLQRLYLRLPPHDTALYDVLGVSPNATALELTRAYRRLSREHHPDKISSSSSSSPSSSSGGSSSEYDKVRNAYEVLKDDTTRLVYHQYGAVDTSEAVRILTGRVAAASTDGTGTDDPAASSSDELLRLMGYPTEADGGGHRHGPPVSFVSRQERAARIASQLLEQLRVVVEGQVSAQTLLDSVIQNCNVVKRQPMGAQILRCVGRAYRHSGQKSLAMIVNEIGIGTQLPSIGWASELVREGFRDAKHLATAVVASGRALAAEKRLDKHVRRYEEIRRQAISYHFDGEMGELTPTVLANPGENDNDNDDDEAPVSDVDDPLFDSVNQNDIDMEQLSRAQATVLQSLQLEALWKVIKIEIDRVVREACELLLSGEYFFVPPTLEGWVGARSHRAVDAKQGRRRAAELLVQIGNIMVEQSKDGTSWLR